MIKAQYIVAVNEKSFFRSVEIPALPQLATNQTYTLKIGEMVFTPKSIEEEFVGNAISYKVTWQRVHAVAGRVAFDAKAERVLIENDYKRSVD
jgi:hypothetical protein